MRVGFAGYNRGITIFVPKAAKTDQDVQSALSHTDRIEDPDAYVGTWKNDSDMHRSGDALEAARRLMTLDRWPVVFFPRGLNNGPADDEFRKKLGRDFKHSLFENNQVVTKEAPAQARPVKRFP